MRFERIILFTVTILFTITLLTKCPQRQKPIALAILPHYEFCVRFPYIKVDIGREPALVVKYKLMWRRTMPLNVFFYGNVKPATLNKVIAVANEWSRHCGISFHKVSAPSDSHIRITFQQGGYSSAVGIEAIQEVYKNKFTMCLQGLDTLNDQKEFRRVVLHEFGHALGLEHELQSPSSAIPWDTAALYKYYYDHYEWQPDSVLKHVLLKLGDVKYSGFDSTSIMVYAVPDTLTKGNYVIRWPQELSRSDKDSIKTWYSKSY
jgi:hypothetical protein